MAKHKIETYINWIDNRYDDVIIVVITDWSKMERKTNGKTKSHRERHTFKVKIQW